MVSTIVKTRNFQSYLCASKFYTAQSHVSLVHQSIETFLDARDANLPELIDQLYQSIQAQVDPILETIWAYSALTYRNFAADKPTFLDRILSVKNLFQLISLCSAPCTGASKCIALLAPLVFKVHGLVVELWEEWSGSKSEKKMLREVRSLVDVILGYISLCCGRDLNDPSGSTRLIRPLKDLVSLWAESDSGEAKCGLTSFFPLVGDGVVAALNRDDCEVGELAGAVVAQMFLVRMCLSFQNVDVRSELEKELKCWAVASLTGMGNVYLFETLLQMLLEPVLPVTNLLNSEDEPFLRNALYDAVLLVDYSIFDLERTGSQSLSVHIKNIALLMIIVAYEATELFRQKSDHPKAISLSNAFSSSRLRNQLFRMIAAHGIGNKPSGSSPKACLTWILDLEQQGLQIFPESFSRFRHKLSDPLDLEGDEDVEFCIDKVGEEQIEAEGEEEEDDDEVLLDGVSDAFMAASRTMTVTETKEVRKRKSGQKGARRKKKHMKLEDGSTGDEDEDVIGCSDVENSSMSSGEDV